MPALDPGLADWFRLSHIQGVGAVALRKLLEAGYAPGVRMDELARSAGRTPMALYKSLHRIRMTLADCVQLTLNQKEELA